MNKTIWIATFAIAGALALAGGARAQTPAAGAAIPATGATTAPSKAEASKPATKPRRSTRRKPGSKYSKATLSAFAPLAVANEPTAAPVPESATQSQVMVNKPAETLDSAPTSSEPTADNSLLNVRAVDAPLLVPDEPALVADDQGATDGVDAAKPLDPDALGNEAVSVIDRDTKRPSAKTLESGLLRVKVKDKGVRAGVQIPLEDPRGER